MWPRPPPRRRSARAVVLAGFKPVFGDLGRKQAFVQALAVQLERLREQGVRAAWRNWSGNRPDASRLASLAQGSPAMKRRLALYVERRDSTHALACGRQAGDDLAHFASVARHRDEAIFISCSKIR